MFVDGPSRRWLALAGSTVEWEGVKDRIECCPPHARLFSLVLKEGTGAIGLLPPD